MPRPLRSSCDRCHAQKLKCPKEARSTTCSRCLKAKVNCVFSPAGPAWRRSSASIAYQNNALLQQNSEGGAFDLDLNWPHLLNAGDLSATNLDYISPSLSDPTPKTTPQDSRSICVRQLSALAVEIHDVFVELSPLASLHLPKGTNPEELYSQRVIHVSHSRCIEQFFIITQRLIDLYPDLLRLLSDESCLRPRENCRDSNCFHTSNVPGDFANIFSDDDPIRDRVDPSLFNLLIACHGKISDVLDCLIKSVKLCAKVTTASPDLVQPRLHIPELRVGNFVASAASASSMQATLLVHITSVLMKNAQLLRKIFEELRKQPARLGKR